MKTIRLRYLGGMLSIVGLLVAGVTTIAEAANIYVRQGAAGTNNGTDWTNARTTFPSSTSINRGDTIYVAGGHYGSIKLDKPTSGTTSITVKKATIADHGTGIGWNDSYASTRADFGQIAIVTSYWVIDGQTRNEANWNAGSAYGMHAASVITSSPNFGAVGSNITVRYLDVGGAEGAICRYVPSASCDAGVESAESFYFLGGPAQNWLIQRVRMHNVELPMQLAGVDGLTLEYSWIGPNWQKEAIRGGNNNTTKNVVIRFNRFVDSCKGLPTDGTGNRCTAKIAIWSTNTAGGLDNNQIYGNLFYDTVGYPGDPASGVQHTDACISIGGNGGSWAGVSTANSKIYNNTIVGVRNGVCTVGFAGAGSNNQAANNLWFSVSASIGCVGSGSTCLTNGVAASASQFVNPITAYPGTGSDFRLASPTGTGTPLPSPYSTDMDGRVRGVTGTWDLGTFEFGVGVGAAPNSPSAVILQ